MKLDPKWLLPPAAALCLFLGPLAMNSGAAPDDQKAPAATAATGGEATTGRLGAIPPLPKTPDPWQVVSTLCGVVLLGIAGVYFARRMQKRPLGAGGNSIALRQSLRLSAKQALHVIEFDDRLLLVGASDAGLALLDQSRSPDAAADEAEVLARAAATDDGDGAVPRDLVIPRPPAPRQQRLPTPAGQKRTPGLGDFRALLHKAGKA